MKRFLRTKRAGALLALLTLSALVALFAASATAVHNDNLFELDGNALNEAAAGDDWSNVVSGTGGFFSKSFIGADKEAPANDTTYFTGGGSKDVNDIPEWEWSATDVSPDKNQITDAFAAAYVGTGGLDGHTILYFGMDRFDTNGDSNVGFWFVQDPTFGTNPDGTFSGQHQNGDIFVVSAFTNGGAQPNIDVYEWQNGGLVLVTSGGGCTTAPFDDAACAFVNITSAVDVPWDYVDKDGNTDVQKNGFFEGGVDLNSIFKTNDLPCFSSFLAETRSSQSPSAQLKDFALGSVSSCGTITIHKNAVPNDGQDFPYTTSGGLSPSTFSLDDDSDATLSNTRAYGSVKPGTYTVSEGAQSSPWQFTDLTCTTEGTGTSVSKNGSTATITLGLAGKVDCTYTNTKQPSLTVNKVLVPANDAGKFNLQIDGTTAGTGANVGNGGTTGAILVSTGSHTVGETAGTGTDLSDYTSSTSCSINNGGATSTSSVSLDPGDSAVCTITNTKKPKLVVIKHVINDDGGTKTAADFTMDVTGSSPSPASFPGAEDPGTKVAIGTGSYSVVEGAHAGYEVSYSADCSGTLAAGDSKTCTVTNNDIGPKLVVIKHVINDNGGTKTAADFTMNVTGSSPSPASFPGAEDPGTNVALDVGSYSVVEGAHAGYEVSYSADCSGSIALGETKTCTVTNNDNAPSLTLDKVVVNDNGGTAAESDWTLSAAGPTPLSGPGAAGHTDVQSDADFDAGTYSLSESSGPSGYAASSWSCVKNGGAPVSGSSITLGLGDSATCTITNDDVAPKLHLVKQVVNDNGGTATVADFTLTADGAGSNDLSGISPVNSEPTLLADTWTLSESPLAGYAASDWVCVGGSQDGSKITVGIGGEATCTITNNDIAPKLHLRKEVVNDNGGTATVADFTLTADGAGLNDLSGHSPVDSDGTLKADTWALSESSVAGYAASDWVCVGGSQDGSSVTLGLGDEATCTITNNDIAPKLHLRKVIINNNSGTATVAEFTLTADGAGSNDLSGTSPVDSGAGLKADTWTLSESGPTGYDASNWVCVGGSQDGNKITVGLAGEATCTITNDDVAHPAIDVIKNPDSQTLRVGGTAHFTIIVKNTGDATLTNVHVTDAQAPGCAHTFANAFAPGHQESYDCELANVTEDFTNSATATGTPPAGEDVTDTDTADVNVVHPSIAIVKSPDDQVLRVGGTANFHIKVTNTGDVTLNPVSVSDAQAPGCARADLGALAPGQSTEYDCALANVQDDFTNSATATGKPPVGDNVTATDTAPVDVIHPAITIEKAPDSQTIQSPGTATWNITVKNTGDVPLTNVVVTDAQAAGCGKAIGTLAVGESSTYTCSLGGLTANMTNVALVTGHPPVGPDVSASDSANVTVTSSPPPPPPPPAPKIDLAVTKVDTPDPLGVGELLTYTMVVTNNGPNTATGVTAADPLPANTTFVSVTSSVGTCANSTGVINCQLGTLAAGASVTITLQVRPTVAGTLTNTVTTVGNEAETNTANNTATATTLVQGPFVPPAVKRGCYALSVKTKQMTVGKRQTLVIKVTELGKPVAGAKVRVSGGGINKLSGKSDKNGMIRIVVTPRKAGIVQISSITRKGCGLPRIGVIGAFTPPVTG